MKTVNLFGPLLTMALIGLIALGIYHMIGKNLTNETNLNEIPSQNQVIDSLNQSIDSH